MDKSTRDDFVEDLIIQLGLANQQIAYLEAQVRQLEAERDQWQTKAVSHD
jgi:hypothetical protein